MNIKLQVPTDHEFLEVSEFSFNNFVEETAQSSGQSIDELKHKLGGPPRKMHADDIWYIIWYEYKNIGFLWMQLNKDKKTAFGYDIYLQPEFRAKGIGRHVMNECGLQLKKLGIHSVDICVFEHNNIARSLYTSLGFKEKKFDPIRRQYTLFIEI